MNFPKVPTFLSLNAIHLIKEEIARKMSQRRKVALKTYLVIRYLFRYFRNIKIQFLANVEINFNRSKNLQKF